MQVYYFSRTGRSKKIAEQLAARYGVVALKIDDHKDWSGKINYMKAGAMALSGKGIPADYKKPDLTDEIIVVFPLWAGTMPPAVKTFVEQVGGKKITAIVTSLGSTLTKRDEFKKVIDLVGQEISLPGKLEL
ncbi:MAG: flavodoxin [Clostridia bacterium]|nr:flavodoxin [Lachnospiraceae bacterium]NCB99138.1 flavodoxin [Clostridia bacterium]NCD02194.1 flavodoxin [Clostridia bacterium]